MLLSIPHLKLEKAEALFRKVLHTDSHRIPQATSHKPQATWSEHKLVMLKDLVLILDKESS